MYWRITPLADVPETIPSLASLFAQEWEPWYGPEGPGDADADLTECLRREGIPAAYVAINDSGAPLGTAALRSTSLPSHDHLTPWLAAVTVMRDHRNRGIASALAAAVESRARREGFDALYTAMSYPELKVLNRSGWEAIDTAATLRETVTVYKLGL